MVKKLKHVVIYKIIDVYPTNFLLLFYNFSAKKITNVWHRDIWFYLVHSAQENLKGTAENSKNKFDSKSDNLKNSNVSPVHELVVVQVLTEFLNALIILPLMLV